MAEARPRRHTQSQGGHARTRVSRTEPTPVATQPSSFLPGIYTSAATFSSLRVRGCSARQSVSVSRPGPDE
eukprot:4621251-Prymnesium_polylepis.1